MRELARRLEVSPGHISQVERDIVAPSIALLYAIVSELEVSMDSLFGGHLATAAGRGGGDAEIRRTPGEARYVQRFDGRKTITIEPGVRWELLAPQGEHGVDFREIVYEPGAGVSGEPSFIRHAGHEFGLVLEGRLHVQIDFDEFELGVGDSLGFDSSRPHRFWNAGSVAARAVWFSNVAGA